VRAKKWLLILDTQSMYIQKKKIDFFENVHDLKNVKIAEKSLKIGQFLPILATFYELNHVLKKVGRESCHNNLFLIFNLIFSESTCYWVSKIRNQNFLRALWDNGS
jgi:poly-D-alanine transfer protein DltD